RSLGDDGGRDRQDARYLLAVIAQGDAAGQDLLVVEIGLVHLRRGNGDGGVGRHHDLPGEERVVVVDIAPVDRARRYIAFLERRGQPLQRRGGRLAHGRIVDIELAVRGDDADAAIGDQELVE